MKYISRNICFLFHSVRCSIEKYWFLASYKYFILHPTCLKQFVSLKRDDVRHKTGNKKEDAWQILDRHLWTLNWCLMTMWGRLKRMNLRCSFQTWSKEGTDFNTRKPTHNLTYQKNEGTYIMIKFCSYERLNLRDSIAADWHELLVAEALAIACSNTQLLWIWKECVHLFVKDSEKCSYAIYN